ncbi:27889_t:CDS:2, partial [Gigaspora margarita]
NQLEEYENLPDSQQSESTFFVTVNSSPTYEEATQTEYETRFSNYQQNIDNYENRINSLENINQTLIKNIKELKETITSLRNDEQIEVDIKIQQWNQNIERIQNFVF